MIGLVNGSIGAAVGVKSDAGIFDTVFALPKGLLLRDVEKLVILETLKTQRFNRTRAAKALGIGIRTLQRKLKQYQDDGIGGALKSTGS